VLDDACQFPVLLESHQRIHTRNEIQDGCLFVRRVNDDHYRPILGGVVQLLLLGKELQTVLSEAPETGRKSKSLGNVEAVLNLQDSQEAPYEVFRLHAAFFF